jgi:hypothetical protein
MTLIQSVVKYKNLFSDTTHEWLVRRFLRWILVEDRDCTKQDSQCVDKGLQVDDRMKILVVVNHDPKHEQQFSALIFCLAACFPLNQGQQTRQKVEATFLADQIVRLFLCQTIGQHLCSPVREQHLSTMPGRRLREAIELRVLRRTPRPSSGFSTGFAVPNTFKERVKANVRRYKALWTAVAALSLIFVAVSATLGGLFSSSLLNKNKDAAASNGTISVTSTALVMPSIPSFGPASSINVAETASQTIYQISDKSITQFQTSATISAAVSSNSHRSSYSTALGKTISLETTASVSMPAHFFCT